MHSGGCFARQSGTWLGSKQDTEGYFFAAAPEGPLDLSMRTVEAARVNALIYHLDTSLQQLR